MIIVIRISGQVNINSEIANALDRLNIKRKYSATVISPTESNMKLLKKLRNFIAFGPANPETLGKLIKERAQPIDSKTKVDALKILEQLGKKSFKQLGLKPFFRLHPPRKGIESKKHFGVGKGVLGDNGEKINELVERML